MGADADADADVGAEGSPSAPTSNVNLRQGNSLVRAPVVFSRRYRIPREHRNRKTDVLSMEACSAHSGMEGGADSLELGISAVVPGFRQGDLEVFQVGR